MRGVVFGCTVSLYAMREQRRRRFSIVALLLGHAFLETRNPFFGRLFDEDHILGKMLLGVDLPFIAPFLLIEAKLRNDRPIFLVQLCPNFGTT